MLRDGVDLSEDFASEDSESSQAGEHTRSASCKAEENRKKKEKKKNIAAVDRLTRGVSFRVFLPLAFHSIGFLVFGDTLF